MSIIATTKSSEIIATTNSSEIIATTNSSEIIATTNSSEIIDENKNKVGVLLDKNNIQEPIDEYKFQELINKLGFIETWYMKELRVQIINLILNNKDYKQKYLEYKELGDNKVSELKGQEEYSKGQIALLLLLANINLSSGMDDFYQEDIDDIITFASGMGYVEIIKSITNLK